MNRGKNIIGKMDKGNGITYYRSGWLIDGSGRPALKNAIFCVKNGLFHKVFNSDHYEMPPSGIIDMSDFTILPTFIDAHVHLAFSGTVDFALRNRQLKKNYENRKNMIAHNMRQHLLSGVTVVRDGGDPNNDVLKFRGSFADKTISRLTVLSPGMAWHAEGRYGSFIGISPKPGVSLAQSVFLEGHKRDHIKLINSGLNSLSDFAAETSSQFKAHEIKLVIDVAGLLKKKVMVHANSPKPVKLALDAGCHSVEHGFFMGESNLILMAEKSIAWVPTVFTMKASMMNLYKKGCDSDILAAGIASKNLEHQLEQLSLARKIGVTVVLGTDAGSPGVSHGFSVKDELSLLLESGYTIEQAIRCATRNGAELLGYSDIGLIAKGMKANFIAVRGVPDRIVCSLDYPDCIFWEGEKISQSIIKFKYDL